MGVKDLNKLIAKYAPAAVRSCALSDFSGKTFALDAYGLLFAYKVVGGSPSGYLGNMYEFCVKLRRANIDAIAVMDSGQPMPEKHAARAERTKRKISATNRLAERSEQLTQLKRAHEKFAPPVAAVPGSAEPLPVPELTPEKQQELEQLVAEIELQERSVTSVEKQLIAITPEDVEAMTVLFQAFGFGVAISQHEGEAGCVQLCLRGAADYVVSNDTDVFCFGDVRVVQNITQPGAMRLVDAALIREGMGFSRLEFIDMCILCGCDFSAKLEGLASLGAYKAIKEHRSIEMVVSSLPKYRVPAEGWTPDVARHVFMSMPCAVQVLESNRDLARLEQLFRRYEVAKSLSPEDAEQIDRAVAQRKISFRQPSISDYFKKPFSQQ